MRLLIVRHAIAVPRGTPGIPDDERRLTPEGESKFREAARGLARVAPRPDVLLTSPLPRAYRTAQLAGEAWGDLSPTAVPALASGRFEDLEAALEEYAHQAKVAVVGHEPDLSALLARLLGVREPERVYFKKGGAALVEVPERLADGGKLLWYLPPKVLRELGQ